VRMPNTWQLREQHRYGRAESSLPSFREPLLRKF
jgi:hypothetical protein